MAREGRAGGRYRALVWIGQLVLVGVVAAFVWQTLAARWEEFRAIDLTLEVDLGWIAVAALLVLATYGLLVEAWRSVLRGWGQRLGYDAAFRIWTVSNLGRYVPGKVWSIAGLAVLAQRAGAAGWAAAGSALVLQAMAIGTGVAVVAASAPGTLRPAWLVVGAIVAIGTMVALSWPVTVRILGRVAGRPDVVPLPWKTLATATAVTALSWLTYGLAFWCLARGLLGPGAAALALPTAVGVFAGGYIVGLIALFAPGGLGVREVVFLGLLTPQLGAGAAVALAAGSRVLLTLTEIAAALVGLCIRTTTEEQGSA